MEEFREKILTGPHKNRHPNLLPLAVIHVRRRYDIASIHIRQTGPGGERNDQVVTALLGQFTACCRFISGLFESTLELNHRQSGSLMTVDSAERHQLDLAVHRLADLMSAMLSAGFLENPVTEPLFRYAWVGLARFLADQVAPVALDGCRRSLLAREGPSMDHETVLWVLSSLWQWHQMATRFEQEMIDFDEWRDKILNLVRFAVGKAILFEPGEIEWERMAHLMRIDQIARIFGQRVGAFLTPGRQNVVTMLIAYLRESQEIAAEEQEFVADFVAKARVEIQQSTSWQSPELVTLIGLAEERGL
jgi:hypothetical protein